MTDEWQYAVRWRAHHAFTDSYGDIWDTEAEARSDLEYGYDDEGTGTSVVVRRRRAGEWERV